VWRSHPPLPPNPRFVERTFLIKANAIALQSTLRMCLKVKQ
jgi:hypothetical protein